MSIEYRFSQQEGLDLLGLFRKGLKTVNGKPVREWLDEHEYHERTCRMVDNGVEFCCSECDRRHDYDDEPQFCMGCGAKVV